MAKASDTPTGGTTLNRGDAALGQISDTNMIGLVVNELKNQGLNLVLQNLLNRFSSQLLGAPLFL